MPRCGRDGIIFLIPCPVSDGTLLYAQKCAKSVKGTPLKIPDVHGVPNDHRTFCVRHEVNETRCLCPAHPLHCEILFVSVFALECRALSIFVLQVLYLVGRSNRGRPRQVVGAEIRRLVALKQNLWEGRNRRGFGALFATFGACQKWPVGDRTRYQNR